MHCRWRGDHICRRGECSAGGPSGEAVVFLGSLDSGSKPCVFGDRRPGGRPCGLPEAEVARPEEDHGLPRRPAAILMRCK